MVKVWDWLRCSHSPSYHISVSSLALYLPRFCAGRRTRWQKLPPLLVHQRTQLCPWSMLWMQFSVNVFNVPFTQWDLANLEHKNVCGEVLRENSYCKQRTLQMADNMGFERINNFSIRQTSICHPFIHDSDLLNCRVQTLPHRVWLRKTRTVDVCKH